MIREYIKHLLTVVVVIFFTSNSYGSEISEIEIIGNKRIPNESIILFSDYKNHIEINEKNLNNILKNLYETNFFKDVSLKTDKNKLIITVIEEALIQSLLINGISSSEMLKNVKNNINLKNRSSFNEFLFQEDIKIIKKLLRSMGYYFSEVNATKEDLEDNKINLIYNITLGSKSKIKNIKFTGNKIFKDRKLRSVIVSEEYKFWKFISGKKYLNEELIKFDENLLKNFTKMKDIIMLK